MSRNRIRFIPIFFVILLSFSVCLAESTDAAAPAEIKDGLIKGSKIGLAKSIVYRCIIQPDARDFVLIGLEGSGMNPRSDGSGITWNKGLQDYNVIDFSIANELSEWNDKKRSKANDIYSAAVISAVLENYGHVKTAGLFAFSKGACGADSVFRGLEEEGFRVLFVWLADPFTAHEMPSIMQAVEDSRIMLYNRYSKKKRLSVYGKEIGEKYGELPNVDSSFVSVSHGGLLKYSTFTEELLGAIDMAITGSDPAAYKVAEEAEADPAPEDTP